MYTSTALLALTSLLSLASAQQNYIIDPNTVPDWKREYWCSQQQAQCPLYVYAKPKHHHHHPL